MDVNEIYTSSEYPELKIEVYNRSTIYYVPYGIVENDGVYTYRYVSLIPENYNYGGLINAIIGVKYSLRETLAIINNYLADPEDEEHKVEFWEMQDWRKFAKSESKKYFKL